jgi:hypothetical protein
MVIRRVLEAGTRLLPLMLVLSVPLLCGITELYPWAHPGGGAEHGAAGFRQAYLQVPFVLGRAGAYFVVWLLLAWLLNRWSRQQEQASEAQALAARQRLGRLSGGGLVLYGLTVTFAAVDWLMSLEPHWFSTIFGLIVVTGQLLVAMAFAILVTAWLARDTPVAAVAAPEIWHDLGNLLLAFVMLWAYVALSQYLIIWFGDLPEEIGWYLHRTRGGWYWVGVLLAVCHFALPFALLLSRQTKRRVQNLSRVAAVLFGIHLVAVFWLVMPSFFPARLHVHWLDVVAPVALGGLWLAVFLWQLQRRSLLPEHDLRRQEVMQHG